MKKKFHILWPLYGAVLLALGIWFGMYVVKKNPAFNQNKKSYNKLTKLIDYLEKDYLTELDTDSIVDLTLTQILSQLDPHSVYIPANEIDDVHQQMNGKFVGIGIRFFQLRDTVTVIKTIPNGPSEKAGIKIGDRIVYADNKPLFGSNVSTQFIYDHLKGKINSKVKLKVYRKSENKTLNIEVKRDEIPIESIDVAFFIDKETAFFKINRFSETTHKEFKQHFLTLQSQAKIKKLIIDLRDNTGGYMDKAIKIVDELLSNNEVIVTTVDKNNKEDIIRATPNGLFKKGEVVILINENSASASEILAGAIQDNDRGNIIGRRSFGKGLVQKDLALGDGSAVRLTIAKYLTPSGRSIQKPYNNVSKSEYFNDFEKRFEQGELYEKDAIAIADSLKFKTKKGRIVYGGGGIVPDVFVGFSKNTDNNHWWMSNHTGFFDNLAFYIIDNNPKDFELLTVDALSKLLSKKSFYPKNINNYLESLGLDSDLWKNLDEDKTNLLKASFISHLFSNVEYYQYISTQDDMIIKALEVLR